MEKWQTVRKYDPSLTFRFWDIEYNPFDRYVDGKIRLEANEDDEAKLDHVTRRWQSKFEIRYVT